MNTRPAFNRIKVWLTEKSVKQVTIAAYLGVSKQTVSKWCNNISQPRIQVLFKIADFLEVDVRELLAKSKFSK